MGSGGHPSEVNPATQLTQENAALFSKLLQPWQPWLEPWHGVDPVSLSVLSTVCLSTSHAQERPAKPNPATSQASEQKAPSHNIVSGEEEPPRGGRLTSFRHRSSHVRGEEAQLDP